MYIIILHAYIVYEERTRELFSEGEEDIEVISEHECDSLHYVACKWCGHYFSTCDGLRHHCTLSGHLRRLVAIPVPLILSFKNNFLLFTNQFVFQHLLDT